MTPFVRAMQAALENRHAATTAFEIADADHWTAAVLRAGARGEDMEQFIPRSDPPPPVLQGAVEPEAEPEDDPLFAEPFEEPGKVLSFDGRMAAAGKDPD